MTPAHFLPEAPPLSAQAEARLRALPKVDLHQHVDGSIPAEVTWELMRHYKLHPADSLGEMRRFLEIQEGEEGTLLAYLDKMHYPLWVTQFYENISKWRPAAHGRRCRDAARAGGLPQHQALARPARWLDGGGAADLTATRPCSDGTARADRTCA